MSVKEIAALPIPTLFAEDGCHVWLWTTLKFLPTGFRLLDGWGIKFETEAVWIKNVGFAPYSWMYSTEPVLFGRVGNIQPLPWEGSHCFKAKVAGHSRLAIAAATLRNERRRRE